MEVFDEAYKKLNKAQKEAVDTIEGPVMVIAGPGTGKTQILTLRIANILAKTDTEPENILALTFTEAATHNMRRRLAELIGNSAYRVIINTFHGFCNDIIRKFPEDFPRIIGSKSITEVDQVAIIETIVEEGNFVLLKPFGDKFLYVRDIVGAISELKREGVTPKDFVDRIEAEKKEFAHIPDLYHDKGAHKGKMKGDYQKLERKLLKNEELARVYELYQDALTEKKQYDFNDMILEVKKVLEQNKNLLQMLQEEHQYILVDEHQDTNNAQNKIVELLMNYHDNPNLFVVGDEKQAIFRFQGASLENFQYFKHAYPKVKLITLTENYRSTQTVLDTAERLLQGQKPLRAASANASAAKEKPIYVAEFSSDASERYFIAHDIQDKINNGVVPEDIAILYRNNKDAFPIARDLARLGIPHTIESDQDLFTQSDVRTLLIILRAIADYGNDIYVTPLLHLPLFDIDPLDAYKTLRTAADSRKNTLYDILGTIDIKSIAELGTKLKNWVKESKKVDLLNFFEHIIRDSGLLEDMLGSGNAGDRFNAVNALFDEVKQLVEIKNDATLADFFVYIETIKKHKLFLKRKAQGNAKGKVRLMTAHRSKGLEFAHVYIIRAQDGIWGGKIDRDRLPLIESIYRLVDIKNEVAIQDNADERRLFYVALTRAKESVTITYAREDAERRETLPSAFIDEIKSELVEDLATEEWEEKFKEDRGFQFSDTPSQPSPKLGEGVGQDNKAFVQELFDKQGLSPTALNNYLECPWKYFYQNLIRIPSAPTIHQAYGIAVHAALQDLFSILRKEDKGKSFLLDSFEGHLNRQFVSERDRAGLLEKGKKALGGWYDTYSNDWNINVLTEMRINGISLETDDGRTVRLTGVLDKVEFIDGNIVNVVDYKTGKSKTRNDVMGNTKSSNGNYYRQLVFYKLLLNHFNDGIYSMQSGTIDFIEPDEKENYHKETFEITDEEVSELTTTIRHVCEEITSLAFWDKTCEQKDCEFCGLRKLMRVSS